MTKESTPQSEIITQLSNYVFSIFTTEITKIELEIEIKDWFLDSDYEIKDKDS